MSNARQVEQAYKRAAARDKKRTPGMKVSGKNVFVLGRLLKAGKRR